MLASASRPMTAILNFVSFVCFVVIPCRPSGWALSLEG